MAYRLSPPTLDIILAPLAEKKRQIEREGKKRKGHIETETERQRHRETQGRRRRESDREREKWHKEETQTEVKIQRETRSMETNSNAVKSVEQQENVNTFPSPTAFTRRGGQTCQRLLTHVSRLPLGRLLGDWRRLSTKDLWLPGKKRKCVIDKLQREGEGAHCSN